MFKTYVKICPYIELKTKRNQHFIIFSINTMNIQKALLGLSLLLALPLAAQESNYVSEVWCPDLGNGKYKTLCFMPIIPTQTPVV